MGNSALAVEFLEVSLDGSTVVTLVELKNLNVLSVLSEVRFGPFAVRAVGLGKYDDLVIGDGLVN